METSYKGYEITIGYDHHPQNPRTEFDNFGKMVCFHRRYTLGDKHAMSFEEAKELASNVEKSGGIVLPLFLYDHSGISISTNSFVGRAQHAEWDSGKIGFIYAERAAILKEYNVKKVTKKIREKVEKLLTAEVETYDLFLRGEVLFYSIERDGESIDSCYGFFDTEEYVLSEAKSIVDATDSIVKQALNPH